MEGLDKRRVAGLSLLLWTVLGVSGLYIFTQTVLFLSDRLAFQLGRTMGVAGLVLLTVLVIIGLVLRPVIGLYLLIFAFPLANLSIQTPIMTISPPNMLVITVALVLIARALFMRPGTRQENPLPWQKLLLFAWVMMATLVSIISAPNSEATSRFLITRVGYALTFLITMALVTNTQRLKIVFRLLVWSASIAASVAIVGGFFPNLLPDQVVHCNEPILPILNTPRCAAFNLSFHPFGTWLLVALAPTVFSIARPDLLGIPRWSAAGAVALLILGLIISQVRGAWLSLLITLLIILVISGIPKNKKGLAVPFYFVAVLVVGVVLGLILWGTVFQPIVAMRSDNIDIRFEEYRLALRLFMQNALFGVGPLDDRFLALGPLGMPGVDNSFLVELAATGVVGFIPFLWLWTDAFCSAFRTFQQPYKAELRPLLGIVLVCLLLQLISLQAYIGIGEKGPWLIMGMAASLVAIDRQEKAERQTCVMRV